MTPRDLKRWRKSLKLSQKEAAHALGLKRRVIQYYEKGERNGDAIAIPLYVRLACYALSSGVTDYAGPPGEDASGGSILRRMKARACALLSSFRHIVGGARPGARGGNAPRPARPQPGSVPVNT